MVCSLRIRYYCILLSEQLGTTLKITRSQGDGDHNLHVETEIYIHIHILSHLGPHASFLIPRPAPSRNKVRKGNGKRFEMKES